MGRLIGPVVDGPRIVPQGKSRTSSDKLPNGRVGFRVTQPFSVHHDGTDLGNYACGDRILAPVTGTLRNRKDPNGALIVDITESDGQVTSVAHLSRYARTNGAVQRGQVVGYVGDTGLGAVCHIHLTRRAITGRNVDPWPLLEQNRPVRVNRGVNIRNAPAMTAKVYRTTTAAETYVSGWNPVKGGWHGLGADPYAWRKIWVNGAYRYVALPLTVLL